MTPLARAADRLSTGSATVARRLASRAVAWCARGRRDDLTGWKAALGIIARVLLLTLGVYVIARIVRALPALMWLISGWWVLVSWRAGKPDPSAGGSAADDADPELPEVDVRTVLALWLDRLTRGRAGIHLDELHRTLTRHPDLAHLKRAEMRAWLDRHHITVDRTLRVGALAGRSGISRATIEGLLQGLSPLLGGDGSTAPLHASDQRVSPVESCVESGVEAGVDPHFDDIARLFA